MKADPFASISQLCHVSSSQEDRLRRCGFAHEPEDNHDDGDEVEDEGEDGSEYDRDAPAGIIMVSPPDSSAPDDLNDNTPQFTDIFQTLPEGSIPASFDDRRDDRTGFVEEGTDGGCTKGEKTVDLGADTDIGSSEVELTQRIDIEDEVIDCEFDTVRDLKRELATKECLSDSRLKKPKTLDKNLNLESSNQCVGSELGESRDQSNLNRASPYNFGSKSVQNDKNCETFGESSTKRKLHFSTEALELETEASDGLLGFSEGLESDIRNRGGCNNGDGKKIRNLGRKSIDDIDKYRYVDASAISVREMMRTKGTRTLPISVREQPETIARMELDSRKNHREITLLDVLRMLTQKCGYDRSLEKKSILDVAKSRGMTFP